jgi:hypothetical protein
MRALERGSVDVRFAPKATDLLDSRELARCANIDQSASQQNGCLDGTDFL